MSRRISANGRYLAERVWAYIERTESGCWEPLRFAPEPTRAPP